MLFVGVGEYRRPSAARRSPPARPRTLPTGIGLALGRARPTTWANPGANPAARRVRRVDDTLRLRPVTTPPSPTRRTPHGSHDRKVGGRHHDPTVQGRDPRSGARGPAGAPPRDALSREGDRRGRLAGRAARAHAGPRSLLGDRVRLAQVRGAAERRPELHHRDRRAGYPLHPRAFQARGRAPAGRLPRLARARSSSS